MASFFFPEKLKKRHLDDLIFFISVNAFNTVIAIHYFEGDHIEHKHRIGNIIENGGIFFLGFFQLLLQQLDVGDVKAHFHGGHHFTAFVFNGRCVDDPMAGLAVLAYPPLFT